MFIASRGLISFQIGQNLTFSDVARFVHARYLEITQTVLWEEVLGGTDELTESYMLAVPQVQCFQDECPLISSLYRSDDILSFIAKPNEEITTGCLFSSGVYYYKATGGSIRTCKSVSPVPYARYTVKRLQAKLPLLTPEMVDAAGVDRVRRGVCSMCIDVVS
jgi:hypothetical protein